MISRMFILCLSALLMCPPTVAASVAMACLNDGMDMTRMDDHPTCCPMTAADTACGIVTMTSKCCEDTLLAYYTDQNRLLPKSRYDEASVSSVFTPASPVIVLAALPPSRDGIPLPAARSPASSPPTQSLLCTYLI